MTNEAQIKPRVSLLGLLRRHRNERPMGSLRQPEMPVLQREAHPSAGPLEHASGRDTDRSPETDHRQARSSPERLGSRWPFRSSDPRFGQREDGGRAGEGEVA